MSLVWKTSRPDVEGWYWVRLDVGALRVVQVKRWRGYWSVMASDTFPETHVQDGRFVAFAGPLARPIEPKPETLATVRYKLSGDYAPPRLHYWDSHEWSFQTREEMLRRARINLCGAKNHWSDGSDCEADSTSVRLWTNRRVNGRWQHRSRPEDFTAATIDAAIAQCAANGPGQIAVPGGGR